jgi:hypothetical protein
LPPPGPVDPTPYVVMTEADALDETEVPAALVAVTVKV